MKRPITIQTIERFLEAANMGPTRFGRGSIGDANLVNNMRAGRVTERETDERIMAFMRAELAARSAVVTRMKGVLK